MTGKIMLCFYLMLMLTYSVLGNGDVYVEPSMVELDIVGGCSTVVNITMQVSSPGLYYIETIVAPDNIGINVSYSTGDSFHIVSPGIYIVYMTINTSMLITPGVYIIETDILYETTNKDNDDGGDDKKYNTYWNPPDPNTTPGSGYPLGYNSSNDSGFNTSMVVDDPTNPYFISATSTDNNMFNFGLPGIVVLGLLLGFYLLRRRKKGEKNET